MFVTLDFVRHGGCPFTCRRRSIQALIRKADACIATRVPAAGTIRTEHVTGSVWWTVFVRNTRYSLLHALLQTCAVYDERMMTGVHPFCGPSVGSDAHCNAVFQPNGASGCLRTHCLCISYVAAAFWRPEVPGGTSAREHAALSYSVELCARVWLRHHRVLT